MISEAVVVGRHFDSEPKTRVVGSGEQFSPFQLPRKEWHGYSGFLSMDPGSYSEILLHSDQLPDLRFCTIIQNGRFPRNSQEWNFWIEADKRHLPFNPDFFHQVRDLRVQVAMPEGNFEALLNRKYLGQRELVFDSFSIRGGKGSRYWLKVDPKNGAYLQQIKVRFLLDKQSPKRLF